jgi:hypothetical protein
MAEYQAASAEGTAKVVDGFSYIPEHNNNLCSTLLKIAANLIICYFRFAEALLSSEEVRKLLLLTRGRNSTQSVQYLNVIAISVRRARSRLSVLTI